MHISKKQLQAVLDNKQRHPLLSVWDKTSGVPPQTILVTKRLLSRFAAIDDIDSQTLVDTAIADTDDAVEPTFSPTALNAINSLYYGYCSDAFTKHGDIADIYVRNRMVQYIILQLLLEKVSSPHIRIQEFCCGSKYVRWQKFAEFLPPNRYLDVTLSDITADIIPLKEIRSRHLPRMTFEAQSYDLRNPFPALPKDERFNALLVTYGFDSVWLPQDVMYVKQNGQWSQILYRVKVLPETPNKEHVLHLLRKEEADVSVPLSLFKNVVIECIAQPIDLQSALYGSEIEELYGDYDEVRVIVPGALVERVEQAFAGHLTDEGIFMIGEVATYPLETGKKIDMTIADYNTTGKVGKYKVEDFWLAERILQHKGFTVDVLGLSEAAKKYGKTISDDTEDTWLMIVSR